MCWIYILRHRLSWGAERDRKANWIEYCIFEVQRIDKNWEMLMMYSSYMNSECIAFCQRCRVQAPFLI